jgi:apolipoprotein N-acyltransferase
MINITNEGWFGDTAAPYQLAAVNVFRAVENRVYIARAANTGISCFIDPFGRIFGRVNKNNRDTFVEGFLTEEIRLSHTRTFYTIYGDVFVVTNMIMIAFMAIACFFKGRR